MLYDNLKWYQKGRQAMKKIVKIPVSSEYLGTPKYQRIPKIRSHILLPENAVREVVKTIEHRQHPHCSTEKKLVGSFSTPPFCGGMCGRRAVNTSNSSGSGGLGFKPRLSRCFLRQGTLLNFVSLHPGV